METDSEFRRNCLRKLVNRLGRGAIAKIARELKIASTTVSRMLADPKTKQSRGISGETVLLLNKLYPGWLSSDTAISAQSGGNRLDLSLVRSRPREVAQDDKEDALLRGYRDASDESREILLIQARLATEKKQLFSERNETK